MRKASKGFAGDNYAGVHPEIFTALQKANVDHADAYGDDEYTTRAIQKFKEHFGNGIEVLFVYSGTGANILALASITQSIHSIICAETAHLNVDECGSPEKFTGCKLLTVPSSNGKITVEGIQKHVYGFGDQHHSQPKVISITEATEFETVYTPAGIY